MLFKLTLSLEGFGKVIPIRLKRPKNQGRTQHNLTTADHEGDSSIPTDLSNPVPAPILSLNSSPVHPGSASSNPGLEEPPTGFPSPVYPWGASPARKAYNIAQVALPSVQAFMGLIPLVGAPMNATIGGLLRILQVINRRDQNKAALDDLTSRLYRLCYHLCNAPPALDTYYSDLSPYNTRERTCIISHMIRASGPWAHGRNILDYDGWAGSQIIPDGGGWAHAGNM
ncbi:hypothetical protein EV702DRAFT_1200457 [Suillus placidus]|uniref:Uncharacterized protein n=1 Tax=Suillus placidus TaxID=48579 RepID=A0A9P7CZR3_9AGAM|nr:hypothetical protein EV702DRAFT_1200457 [Suillus placidus]